MDLLQRKKCLEQDIDRLLLREGQRASEALFKINFIQQ